MDAVQLATPRLLAAPGFEPNMDLRRCRLPKLEASDHSGASLAALHAVLTALRRFDDPADKPDMRTDPQGETDERQHSD